MGRRLGTLLVGFALVATGCGSDNDAAQAASESPSSTSGPETSLAAPAQADLECETLGYPCSLDQVPSEILKRSDELANSVLVMFADGASTVDAADMLAGEADVVGVEADEHAMRFRVDGGRGTWILRSTALGARGAPGGSGSSGIDAAAHATFRVVGDEDEDAKRALVLSPYEWQFGAEPQFDDEGNPEGSVDQDDGREVAEILSTTRGYEGRVDFYGNVRPGDTDVNVDSFRDWHAYDVIHVVSHGTSICEGDDASSKCRGAVAVGRLEGLEPGGGVEIYDTIKGEFKQKGVELGKAEGAGRGIELVPPSDLVLLTADFFAAEYPTGLDNAVVFFNACELMGFGVTDLVESLAGSRSVVLGWTNTVISEHAYTAALAMYEDLAERGFHVDASLARLGVLRKDPWTFARLRSSGRLGGGDLRVRDIVYVHDAESGAVVQTGDAVAIDGTVGDGEPDSLPFVIGVDGIGEGNPRIVDAHLTVDGIEVFSDTVSAGEENRPGEWTITGTVPLGFDVEEGMAVTLRAWVNLADDEGISDHEVYVNLVGGGEPIMGWTWELEITQTIGHRDLGTAFVTKGTLRLEFDKDQAFDDPFPRYRAVSGTVTAEAVNQTDTLSCTYSMPKMTFEVTPEMLRSTVREIPADLNPYSQIEFADNYLYFDTTATPAKYWGNFSVSHRPTRAKSLTCPNGSQTLEDTVSVSWPSTAPRNATPLEKQGLIVGSDVSGTTGYSDREWTITRLD